MKRTYIFLTIVMFLLAFGTLFFKEPVRTEQIEATKLIWNVIEPSRYMTTDQIAKAIMQKRPSLEIIDLRSEDEFKNFSLPGSINIPLDSLLNRNNLMYFGVPGITVVFIANDDIASDQAWVLTKRLGFNNTYVMKGGLNRWMETIIEPKEPAETEPATAFQTYEFRNGARMYFTGAKVEIKKTPKIKTELKRRQKTNVVEGGC